MREKIEKVLDEIVRPYLRDHKGDIKISRVEGDTVFIQLLGQCTECAYADLTVGDFITTSITENVPGIHHVIQDTMDIDFFNSAMDFVRSLKEKGEI